MLRLVLIELALFFLPFLVWFGLSLLRRNGEEAKGGTTPDTRTLVRLGTVGALFVAVSLIGLSLFHQGAAEGTYVPDRFENGRLVPGYIK